MPRNPLRRRKRKPIAQTDDTPPETPLETIVRTVTRRPKPAPDPNFRIVREGETLASISETTRVQVRHLRAYNGMNDVQEVQPGQRIRMTPWT